MVIKFNAEVTAVGNNINGKPRIELGIEGQQNSIEIEMNKENVSKFWNKLYKKIEIEINFKEIE